MTAITDEMLKILRLELDKQFPSRNCEFAFEVESMDYLLIHCIYDHLPDREQLEFLVQHASDSIDSIIPIGEKLSTWLAIVRVGATRVNNLAVGGDRIGVFQGKTEKYGQKYKLY